MESRNEEFFFRRPIANEERLVGEREVLEVDAREFDGVPKIGLVISTFAALPYVHLSLEMRKRLYPALPTIVHDDCSEKQDELADLCKEYGVEFQANSARLGHQMGDLSSIIGGLTWAAERGVELLAKMSRRFVPVMAWTGPLGKLAEETQGTTFAQPCRRERLPIRSECMAISVKRWSDEKVLGEMTKFMLTNQMPLLLEFYLIEQARRAWTMRSKARLEWEKQKGFSTVETWPYVTPDRNQPGPGFLWQSASLAEEYARQAAAVGLKYGPKDFLGYSSQMGV